MFSKVFYCPLMSSKALQKSSKSLQKVLKNQKARSVSGELTNRAHSASGKALMFMPKQAQICAYLVAKVNALVIS